MTKAQMKELIIQCIEHRKICSVYFKYDYYYKNMIPL